VALRLRDFTGSWVSPARILLGFVLVTGILLPGLASAQQTTGRSGGCCGRVALYYGHAGLDRGHVHDELRPERGQFERLAALYESFGTDVQYTGAWPRRPRELDLLILLRPGAVARDQVETFSRELVDDILWMLAGGGRLVIFSDPGTGESARVTNELLRQLHADIRLSDRRVVTKASQPAFADQLNESVGELRHRHAGRLELEGTAIPLFADQRERVVAAVDHSAHVDALRPGSDVVVIYDSDVLDDWDHWESGSGAKFAPAWEALARALLDYDGCLSEPEERARRKCWRLHGDEDDRRRCEPPQACGAAAGR